MNSKLFVKLKTKLEIYDLCLRVKLMSILRWFYTLVYKVDDKLCAHNKYGLGTLWLTVTTAFIMTVYNILRLLIYGTKNLVCYVALLAIVHQCNLVGAITNFQFNVFYILTPICIIADTIRDMLK